MGACLLAVFCANARPAGFFTFFGFMRPNIVFAFKVWCVGVCVWRACREAHDEQEVEGCLQELFSFSVKKRVRALSLVISCLVVGGYILWLNFSTDVGL